VNANGKNGTVVFQPRARLLKLIGEELISDEVVAISELVKNSHDADASTVTVRFRGVTGSSGQIEILDDGGGMDLDTLLGRWMEPAASTKVGKGRQVTRRGRRVLGEKGVGRFAADKIARHLEIVSRCPRQPEEVRAVIDWDRFDTDELMLSQVENRWEVRPAVAIRGHGTLLRMSGLRSPWSERTFRRLCIRLSRLLSPFRETDHFAIHIESDEFPEYSGELRADFLQKAPYRIEAEFDGVQSISLALGGQNPVAQRWNGQGELTCGPVRIRLFAFDLEAEALARIGPRTEVRAWLREWTGVSVYRDGFRVWPYGEPHDDWLRLDQRRVNNPVEHLSNNQVIGFIDIGRDRNPDLMDQTNREGLIHNPALEDLRRLVYFVLQAIEAERQSIRHPVRRLSGTVRAMQTGARSAAAELERLASRAGPAMARELRQLQKRVEEDVSREAAQLKQTVAGYSGLAAVGQMTAGLMPIMALELRRMQRHLAHLADTLAGRRVPQAREAMAGLDESLASIDEYCRMMLASSGSNERRRAIDVVAEVHAFQRLVEPLLAGQGVGVEVVSPSAGVLRTEVRPENFCCLLQILTTNSLEWLRGIPSPRIRIHIAGDDEHVEITFSDNGPGFPFDVAARIFEPMFTRKEGGRGMGLTVARQLVEAHGGYIYALTDRRRHGANFRISLPRKRSRATIYPDG
jgi:signal transduction histidine kinase